jgi:hypothetical protein
MPLGDAEYLVGPGTFVLGERTTGFSQRFG